MKIKVPGPVTRGWVVITLMLASPMVWAIELPAGPLANLTSEEFRQREQAQTDLLAWARQHPEPAMDALFHHSREATDPEARERSLAVLRELVNDEYLTDGKGEGYLGIRMQDEIANLPGDPKPRAVIRVIQVIPDSAAQHAGLLPNDLIAGLGDLVWHEGAVSRSFSEQIRQLKPKSKVVLKVSRNGQLMDLEVSLGRRPFDTDPMFLDGQPADPEAAERKAKDAYFHSWLESKKAAK